MYIGETAEQMHTPPEPAGTWVHEVLEPDQLSTAKPRFGRRTLSRTTVIVLWALRIYVLLMLLLIALQMWNALHAGAETTVKQSIGPERQRVGRSHSSMSNLHRINSEMKPANLERGDRHLRLGAEDRSTESGEDYLACIFELLERKGYARVADVAESLSVAEPSASAMIKRLAQRGYLKH